MGNEKLDQLVRRMQSGDAEAASDLYLQCRDDLYYYIMKTVNDPHLAEDLLQDTFMEILQTVDKLKEPAAFVAWSRQIAYHRCTGYFRKRHELLADENEDGQTVFDTVEEEREEFIPEEALNREDLKQTIHQMMADLPEEQRSALLLRYFDELSVSDIAKIQGVSEGTVKSRLNYGRKAMRQTVEGYEKKNGIRLHCAGVVPLLLWFFREQALAKGASLTAKGVASVATATRDTMYAAAAAEGAKAVAAESAKVAAAQGAKQVAAEGAKQVAAQGAKKAAGITAKRMVASIAATAIASSLATAGTMKLIEPETEDTNPKTVISQQVDDTDPTDPDIVPVTTQPDPLALPSAGSAWEGYGNVAGFDRWFDMTLDTITETEISGQLTLTLGASTYHITGFSGTGTEKDGKITYAITLIKPHLLSDILNVTLEGLDLVYDRQGRTFTMDYQYDVTLRNTEEIKVQDLPTGTWSGMGNDDGYIGKNNEHAFTLSVDQLSTAGISGQLTVSYQGLVDHDTAFTGRCRPRSSDGTFAYDIVLETPRTFDVIGGDYIMNDLTIIYDPGTGTFHFAGLQFYEATLEKS